MFEVGRARGHVSVCISRGSEEGRRRAELGCVLSSGTSWDLSQALKV